MTSHQDELLERSPVEEPKRTIDGSHGQPGAIGIEHHRLDVGWELGERLDEFAARDVPDLDQPSPPGDEPCSAGVERDILQVVPSRSAFSSVGWSPTGEWIAFSGSGAPAVSLADPDGHDVVSLASTEDACCPVWSPDGTQLLVQRGLEGARDLWIVGGSD